MYSGGGYSGVGVLRWWGFSGGGGGAKGQIPGVQVGRGWVQVGEGGCCKWANARGEKWKGDKSSSNFTLPRKFLLFQQNCWKEQNLVFE